MSSAANYVKFRVVDKSLTARYAGLEIKAPRRGTAESAGIDLWGISILPSDPYGFTSTYYSLQPGETRCFNTNLSVELPPGHYGRVAPRSGLSISGIIVNAGVIDRDYTGALGVVLTNVSSRFYTVDLSRPIAQLIITPYATHTPMLCLDSDDRKTLRGDKGYGSTDTAAAELLSNLRRDVEELPTEKRAKLDSRMTVGECACSLGACGGHRVEVIREPYGP